MRVTFADIVFDSEERSLSRAGTPVHLSPKGFDLLGLLVGACPRVVRKKVILDTLWPDVIVEEANIRNLVAEIRAVIGEPAARAIVTLPRIGYSFRGEVGRAGAEPGFTLTVDGEQFRLSEGDTIVGRGESCGIAVGISGVSRRHFRITVDRSGATIEDLGSTNGTWVNGRRLMRRMPLVPGDEIGAGQAILSFAGRPAGDTTTTLTNVISVILHKR